MGVRTTVKESVVVTATGRHAAQLFDGILDGFEITYDIEAAFGRDLVGAFGDERDGVGLCACCDRDHLVGRGHFDVEIGRDVCL